MNRTKSKEINKLAAQLMEQNKSTYMDETVHVCTKFFNNQPVKMVQRFSGRRKAKRDARERLGYE